MMRDILLEIAGQEIKIRSDEDEEYVRTLARYVDDKLEQLRRTGRGATTLNLALAAALAIADELHKVRSGSGDVEGALAGMVSAVEASIEAFDSQTN